MSHSLLPLLKKSVASWSAHKAPKMGAALAYYTVFSMAPLIVLLVGIAGIVVEQDTARQEVVAKAAELMGQSGADTVETILENSAKKGGGIVATVIGAVTLLLGASVVFAELQDSLNTIWEVAPRKQPWTTLIRKRLLAFSMVFALGLLVLLSLVASAVIAGVGAYLRGRVPGFDLLWEGVNTVVLLAIVTLLFATIFRFLPETRIAWRDVWTGAAITGALFILGKFLLGIYIARSAFSSAYGAAGSLIVILLWVFYSAQIFFFGAEFTRAFARRHGSHASVRPPLPAAA